MKTPNLSSKIKSFDRLNNSSAKFCILLTLLTFCFFNGKSQIVAVPLNHTGLIATIPTGPHPSIQSIVQVCGFGADISNWLDVTTHGRSVRLAVKDNSNIPNPALASASGTVCTECSTCNGLMDYLGSDNTGCYRINVTISGITSVIDLCIYGDLPLTISADDSYTYSACEGDSEQKRFRVNRSSGYYAWEITTNSPGGSISVFDSQQGTIDAGTTNGFDIKFTAGPISTETYTLTVRDNNSDETFSAILTAISRNCEEYHKPKDLVFVVDVSGSMGLIAKCFTQDDISKLDLMKYKYDESKDLIMSLFGPNDRYGYVTFESTAKKVSGNSLKDRSALDADMNEWIGDMNASGSTSMGDGIKKAIEILGSPDANRDKYIILLTNGMQNTSPLVKYKSGVVYIDDDPDIILNEDYKIIPIAVYQPSGDYLDLLKRIAKATSGVQVVDICDVNLVVPLNEVQSSNSPRLIVRRLNSLSDTTATETFAIDEKFDKIVITVSTSQNNNITFDVEKKSGDKWQDFSSGSVVIPTGISPHRVFSKPISAGIAPEGEYRVIINSDQPNITYRLYVIIDDRGIKHSTYSGIGTYRSGNSISLATRLSYFGNPIPNDQVTFVKAYIRKPDFSFTNEFSKKKVPSQYVERIKDPEQKSGTNLINPKKLLPPTGHSFEPNLPIIDQKFQILQYETDFMEQLSWSEDVVDLQSIGNGIYQGSFKDTRLTGVYDIRFEIEGNHAEIGAFKRTELQSVPVLFSVPELEESKLMMLQESPMYISFKPVDKSDNLLGPGKAEDISIDLTAGSIGRPMDNMDGSYVIPLSVPDAEDPNITIKIHNEILYKGPLAEVPRKKSTLAIWGGYATPSGSFNNNYDPGYNVELKYHYNLNRSMAINIEGGYYSFLDTNSDPYSIYGGAAGVKYFNAFGTSAWHMYIDANGGYYKPKTMDGAFGLNAGVSFIRYFNHWLSGGFDYSYYKIFTAPDQIDFMTFSIGVGFHF